jgi:uncharacterized protein
MSDPATNPMAAGPVVENDPAQRSQAMIAHLLGLLGILGTGIYYLIKKNDAKAGPFVKDQMKEAFNFQLAIFVVMIALNIVSAIVVGVTHSALLASLIGLLSLVIYVGVLVLLVLNAIKANKGIAARYPFKIPALK